MKKSLLILVIAGFLVIGLSEVQAQTTQPKLNQVELIKQMLGNWRVDFAKDTVLYMNNETFGTGFTCYFKTVVKNTTISETKELCGYDSKLDKYVAASLEKGKDIEIYALWFKSNTKYEGVPLSDVSNPDKAAIKIEGEIKSKDEVLQTTLINGKIVVIEDYKRIK
jgi:hypothetical protein